MIDTYIGCTSMFIYHICNDQNKQEGPVVGRSTEQDNRLSSVKHLSLWKERGHLNLG